MTCTESFGRCEYRRCICGITLTRLFSDIKDNSIKMFVSRFEGSYHGMSPNSHESPRATFYAISPSRSSPEPRSLPAEIRLPFKPFSMGLITIVKS